MMVLHVPKGAYTFPVPLRDQIQPAVSSVKWGGPVVNAQPLPFQGSFLSSVASKSHLPSCPSVPGNQE